jgi:hypothetical protein
MPFLNAPSLNVIFLSLLPYAASIQASASTLSFARIAPELFPVSFFVLVIFFLVPGSGLIEVYKEAAFPHARASDPIPSQAPAHFTLYAPLSLGTRPYYNMIQFMLLLVPQLQILFLLLIHH